jgi:transposase
MVRKRRAQLKLPGVRETEVNQVPREGKFTLHKTTRKAMRNIAHFQFRQRLIAKAQADPQKVKDIIITTEEYTTKQCPMCDFVHHKIGSKKIFECENTGCKFIGGRDCVGAFNIHLRSIVKNEIIPSI